MKIANSRVKKILVDSGSSADIITLDCLLKLKYTEKDVIPTNQPLIGFGGGSVYPLGHVKLAVKPGERGKGRSLPIDFLVVDTPLPYNVIMGRPTMNKIKVAISVYQLLLQYETDDGQVGKIYGDQQTARECYINSFRTKAPEEKKEKKRKREEPAEIPAGLGVYISENPKYYERPRPVEEVEEVVIEPEVGHTLRIGSNLNPEIRSTDSALKELRMFCLFSCECKGEPRLCSTELNIKEGFLPIKQKLRHQGPERNAAAAEEVKKLLEAGIIEECQYTEWLANMV
ncbi:uncharacterized protein LOC130589711 [Beta vulgaris subsp. vulgaris]|uniref:uncharacterized protein LOC130589711 n=1 Tax=Beta vulgaris subsp. vulgaris TaxID=3555 RepID=UPI0025469071|nr:uncharacterized protein LOC130589711 [Beta vulgaris subsp. vulgaris]